MVTPVFLTVDTELTWRHHAAGLDAGEIVARSLEPAGVGVTYQLRKLREHGLKATFFVDPMPALVYGLEPIKAVVGAIRAFGQEVQLHLHPNWGGADATNRESHGKFELIGHGFEEQRDLIAAAADLLVSAGAEDPIAFRAGSYSANDETLRALAELGFTYDSSHNGADHPWPSAIGLEPTQIAPLRHCDMTEVPVTVIEARPGRLRPFQICALSVAEMRAALDHAQNAGHAAVTVVSHGFELANREGTRVNAIHRRRFDILCEKLERRADRLPTVHFADRPELALGQFDAPLGPDLLRTSMRQAEQLWSNLVEERAA